MAEELEALWQRLSLTEEEDENIILGSSSTKAAKERGKNYLVMKILSRKSIMLDALWKKFENDVEAKQRGADHGDRG
ncbi:hypothetical protein CFP56_042238 [Quercus suber]|uniref:Uncharacterized protein n=1 Tax=Quercus suber TaxID=58331 RepID=A0AAW0MBE9_QUESU|nr:hypothetical protein CFP56_31060 [Quercus suber]